MRRLPLALEVAGRDVLVVGGGAVAERKVCSLLECGAEVRLVAPELSPHLHALAEAGDLTWLPRCYTEGDVGGAVLVFAATDDDSVNRRVAADAAAAGRWCNVASPPEAGTCHSLAVVDRGEVQIAIGTAGASPYAARRLRERIEAAVPVEVARLVGLIGELRGEVIAAYQAEEERRAAYDRMWSSQAVDRLRDGDEAGARAVLRDCLRAAPCGANVDADDD